jgi:SAM-dependent methyltransferase
MTQSTRRDAWQAGDNYDRYMGRWSRQIAPRFLDWLGLPEGSDWLEVGCGTGVLTSMIVTQCKPKSVTAIDPSEDFLAKARVAVPDQRTVLQPGDAQALPVDAACKDAIVSGLVLNFVPDKSRALAEMQRVGRPGATIAFYVWDYPGGGVEFLHAFWTAAVMLDPAAVILAEDRRFSFCTKDGLIGLAKTTGLSSIETTEIVIPTIFNDFDDYWHPFTLGTGPAPSYCAGLPSEARQRLKDALYAMLPRLADGSIQLKARVWAVRTSS